MIPVWIAIVFSIGFLVNSGTISSRRLLMDFRLEEEELDEQLLVPFLLVFVSIKSQESWGIGLVAKSGWKLVLIILDWRWLD